MDSHVYVTAPSASVPIPLKVIVAPVAYALPSVGRVIVALGAVFPAVMVTEVKFVAMSLSVAVNVIVCVPFDRALVEKDEPVPICPSRLDVHTRELPESGPSSASVTVELNTIVSPWSNEESVTGVEIVTDGTVFVTVIFRVAVPVDPSLSVTASVMVCVPGVRVSSVRGEPVPSCPSLLDDQESVEFASVPSSESVPEPINVM